MGSNTRASGNTSTAMGLGTIASGDFSTALGLYNVDVPNALFMIGNGNSTRSSNALTVLRGGKVGIGIDNPLAPLHVAGQSSITGSGYGRLFNFATNLYASTGTVSTPTSIIAEAAIISKTTIAAFENIAASDNRIKNIISLSNNAEDLARLREIEITNYSMKDVATWGNQTFKKVIAQQVEEVYPQAVRKMTSIIPDIYVLADKVVFEATSKHLTVSMSKNYDIKIGETIEFILEKEGKAQGVVALVAGNSFMVKNWQYPTDKIFVFGREVKDFRSVDYEAISMLGISAIQQLAKENELLLNEIKKLKDDGTELNTRLGIIEGLLSNYAKGK